uniref:Knl1 C-terminal RWD domain-containing protein n=1 Tax=Noccaea caerulescens TaxID=107243 RepID=A0A1J3EBD6_NOCCA
MASEKPEDPMNNTAGTDEETIAQRRKRLRRVSFADREITSVHIFKRDEDYETPPNTSASKPQNGEQADTSESDDKVIRFFSDDAEGDGDAEDDKSFLRPRNSPSSGGSTIRSATSDDENDFYGPVSSNFINPGRLSDTTISEEHYEQTMDSTAFSMHFRSLAMSESGDIRTPTSSSHIQVEERTPTHVTSRSDTGSAMVLTNLKKLFPKSPLPVDKSSGGGDSNDMSIVGENSRKYDYGHISPALAALLGDESNELPLASSNKPVRDISLSPQNGSIPITRGDAGQMLSPYGSGYHRQIELQESGNEASFSSLAMRRPNASLLGILPQSFSCVTPSPKQGGSFMSRETLALVESLSTIQKSKSRLGLIPPSPASALSQRIEKSRIQLSGRRSVTTPLSTIGREEIGVRRETRADIPITNLDDLLSIHDNRTPVSELKGTPDQSSFGALSPVADSSDVFARISPEENTNSETEGSLLKQQETNQPASTPDKFVSSLANPPNATPSALENFVTLHDQEQHSGAIGNSETADGNVTKDCASNYSMNTLSDNMDSLLADSSVLLSETVFLNGSAHRKEKDRANGISAAHCDTDVISTEDFPAVVTEDLPGTSGSPSMGTRNEASHAKGPARLKRKAKDVDCAARNCSPRVKKSSQYISNPVMDHPDGNCDVSDCRVVREQVINWAEIPGKVSVDINQVVAPLADKLNSRLIYKLEDILTHLKKVHLCEMRCLHIKSQKVFDDLSGAKTKRRAEIRSSLCELAYEKAKLEVLHLQKEIMTKKFQALSTGIQTSETLRLSCAKLRRQHDFHSTDLLNPEQAHEVTSSKVAEKTQEIEVLDSRIKNLVKCFPTCDKMTEELAYADTITVAEDNLKMKMSCRVIRQDVLVWKVDSLGERNDGQSIVLNYMGLINQRLTLKPGQSSSVLISNTLSDRFIKHFPEMNVSIAFNSLFNAEYSRKYVGSSTLLEITQKTSLVLHNLLDVAEELQLARMEMPNLIQGNFETPSEEQLHLQITFIDCKNFRKVIMILDMACLTHGKYPGDVDPCELLEVSSTKRDRVESKQLMNEIESAMDGDGVVGYPRILRLCRCVSKMLQSQIRR